MEEWKSVEDFPLYEVSNMGRVRSIRHIDSLGRVKEGKILKPCYDGRGLYVHVNLYKDGTTNTRNIHRLVARAFIDNPNDYPEVNHIDEDKTNNRVENLEWCSHLYNNNYGSKASASRGEKNAQSRLTREIVQYIRENHVLNGGCFTGHELGMMFNISDTHISAIIHNRRWKHDNSDRLARTSTRD